MAMPYAPEAPQKELNAIVVNDMLSRQGTTGFSTPPPISPPLSPSIPPSQPSNQSPSPQPHYRQQQNYHDNRQQTPHAAAALVDEHNPINNRDELKRLLLQPGEQLNSRWLVETHLTEGGFGQIYLATDMRKSNPGHNYNLRSMDETKVAIKTEPLDARLAMLRMEVTALRDLNQQLPRADHMLKLYDWGQHNHRCSYMVMELTGPNLRELKKRTANDQFSPNTSLRVTAQMIDAVRECHLGGWLHRDVKPSNFCLRLDNTHSHIMLIDFGLARRFVDNNGRHVAPRAQSGFHGTARYASINTHEHRDMGRLDDLWPIVYAYYEQINGQLPWRTIPDKDRIRELKRDMALCDDLHFDCAQFLYQTLKQLAFADEPPYMAILQNFERDINATAASDNYQYDWQRTNTAGLRINA